MEEKVDLLKECSAISRSETLSWLKSLSSHPSFPSVQVQSLPEASMCVLDSIYKNYLDCSNISKFHLHALNSKLLELRYKSNLLNKKLSMLKVDSSFLSWTGQNDLKQLAELASQFNMISIDSLSNQSAFSISPTEQPIQQKFPWVRDLMEEILKVQHFVVDLERELKDAEFRNKLHQGRLQKLTKCANLLTKLEILLQEKEREIKIKIEGMEEDGVQKAAQIQNICLKDPREIEKQKGLEKNVMVYSKGMKEIESEVQQIKESIKAYNGLPPDIEEAEAKIREAKETLEVLEEQWNQKVNAIDD